MKEVNAWVDTDGGAAGEGGAFAQVHKKVTGKDAGGMLPDTDYADGVDLLADNHDNEAGQGELSEDSEDSSSAEEGDEGQAGVVPVTCVFPWNFCSIFCSSERLRQ